jgi:hypothetical protein
VKEGGHLLGLFVYASDAGYCAFAQVDMLARGISKKLQNLMHHLTVRALWLEEDHSIVGYSVCGHQVVWHRLTGAFVAYNRRYLKSWVGNSSEGPF